MRDTSKYGEDVDLTVDEVAQLFGVEPKTWMNYVRDGLVPSPLGIGSNLYYSGTDIKGIRHFMGRWKPQRVAAENAAKRGKGKEEETVGGEEN